MDSTSLILKHARPQRGEGDGRPTAFSQLMKSRSPVRDRSADRSAVEDPYLSTYAVANKRVVGDDVAGAGTQRKIVGYTGYTPQATFQHGSNYQAALEKAQVNQEKIQSLQHGQTTLRGPEDVEAPYRPRDNAPPPKPVSKYPVGYKGYIPGKNFEFGETFSTLTQKIIENQEHEREVLEMGAHETRARGIVPHKTNIGAEVPTPPIYKGKGHVEVKEGLREEDTRVARKLAAKKEVLARNLASKREETVALYEEDEQAFSNPSYLKTHARREEAPRGFVPGYTGNFHGKHFDLGESYGVRTRKFVDGKEQF